MVEFQLEDVLLVIFILNMVRKPNAVNGKNGPLKVGKTKNGGIRDNNNNARVTHRLVQGYLYGEVRAKRSQLLSSSPEFGLHVQSCALLRFCCSFWQFRVQTVATAMNATGSVQITPHRTHTRAFFVAAHATCHYTCGSRPDDALCV